MDRADRWKLRDRVLAFGRLPLLMGIVNVTPDSFSDGGEFFDPTAAVEQGLRLAAEGAAIIDIGGQSTRPGSLDVDTDEELRRVMPVIEGLREQTPVPLSVDTSKAEVAQAALDVGVQIVNDVTGLASDAQMIDVVLRAEAAVCAMHMLGEPRTMQKNPRYGDVVQDVLDYLRDRRDALAAAGIEPERIALDPGIGFGKTTEHNLTLLSNAARFHALGCPVLIGHSRKRFIGQVIDDDSAQCKGADRTPGTIAVSLALARQGVQIIRVHDVAAVRQALQLFDASGGLDP